jgi:hypothetical protein
MPTLQISFETMSSAFRLDQSWRLKIFPLAPSLILKLIINTFRKSSFGTHLKIDYTPLVLMIIEHGLDKFVSIISYGDTTKFIP